MVANTATKIYRGLLCKASNGEEDDLLGLVDEKTHEVHILVEDIQDDMELLGKYLTLHYFTSDKPLSEAERTDVIIRSGEGEAIYGMRYSDVTGYLWTDENFTVGGHRMLNELSNYCGQYIHMEITFSRYPH